MLRERVKVLSGMLAIAALLLTAGCGAKQASDTKVPAAAKLGSIDMAKTIKAHPKYTELDRLHKEMNTLAAEREARLASAAASVNAGLPEGAGQALAASLEQDFNTKMAQKQKELEKSLNDKADQFRKEATEVLEAYGAQLEEEYQSRIFSLQLKLKAVQLDQAEASRLQQEIEALKLERSQKFSVKEQELAAGLEKRMRPAEVQAQQELAAYAGTLQADNQARYEKQTAEMAGRAGKAPDTGSAAADIERQMAMKTQ